MNTRFFRRIPLFGGFGINVGKNGIGESLRTPFGSISDKMVSIPTPIKGLQLRHYWNKETTTKQEVAKVLQEEIDRLSPILEQFTSVRQEQIEMFKSITNVDVPYPSDEWTYFYNSFCWLKDTGNYLIEEFNELITFSAHHRTGLTDSIRQMIDTDSDIFKITQESLKNFNTFQNTKNEEDAKNSIKELLSFYCYNCNQHIEVNASAKGVAFKCPTCNTELTVP